MVMILMLAAPAMQAMRAEGRTFVLWKLWSPFVFIALPTMLLTGSLALLFETIPLLSGGVGNVAYFFLWSAMGVLGATGFDDPFGLQLIYRSTRRALIAADFSSADHFNFSLTVGGASLFFHRFDPARSSKSKPKAPAEPASRAGEPVSAPQPAVIAHLSPLARTSRSFAFFRLIASELRLMLEGRRWWWWTIAAGMLVGQVVSPDANVRSGFLVAAWIWPILLWSQMGCREARYSTSALLFSSERSLSRQLPALWIAGVLVAVFMGSGVALRFMFAADFHSLVAWLAGALFIPSLALALCVWTNSSKAFEAIYTLWWYVGPAHRTPGLDFMGTSPASSQPGVYAAAAMILLAAAYWRRRQGLGYA
jgi:hypothetical protein